MHGTAGLPKAVRWHRRVVVACLFATFALASGCAPSPSAPLAETPFVSEVVDGDTIIVTFPSGQSEIVRLLGVDTPETVDPSRPVQCFGAEASSFVADALAPGTVIYLERDVEARDRYGRLLAYVFRKDNDRFINAELLSYGFADLSIYPPNDGYAPLLESALLSAQTQSLGLWSACGGADVPIDPEPVTLAN